MISDDEHLEEHTKQYKVFLQGQSDALQDADLHVTYFHGARTAAIERIQVLYRHYSAPHLQLRHRELFTPPWKGHLDDALSQHWLPHQSSPLVLVLIVRPAVTKGASWKIVFDAGILIVMCTVKYRTHAIRYSVLV